MNSKYNNHGRPFFSAKGIIVMSGVLLTLIGGIMVWSQLQGKTSSLSTLTGVLLTLTLANLAAYKHGWPTVFAATATFFFFVAPALMAGADSLRLVANRTKADKVALAGLILQFIGSPMSFFGVNTDRLNWAWKCEPFILLVIDAIMISGVGVLGNQGLVATSAQGLIVSFIYTISACYGSRALSLASVVLSSALAAVLLVPVFATPAPRPRTTAFTRTSVGQILILIACFLIFFFTIVNMNFLRRDRDQFLGLDEIEDEQAAELSSDQTKGDGNGKQEV